MKARGPFQFEKNADGTVITVWLGPPNDPESEYVCAVAVSYIPALIAILSAAK